MDQGKRLWQRLILVQGHRRSGTTWLAAVLGKAEEASLIPYEPLWLKHHPATDDVHSLKQMRSERRWLYDYDSKIPTHLAQVDLIRRHLNSLVHHYYQGPVDTLVVKEPHPNWMPLLKAAYKPDFVLYLDRHPLGILNSYEKSALYERWETTDEWQKFLRNMQSLRPELISQWAKINHAAKRIILMAYYAREFCLQNIEQLPYSLEKYEALCLEPYKGFERIYHRLGWQWNENIRRRIKPLIDPEGENEPGFVAVRKRSYDRAYAWRSEMALHLIHSINRFLEEIGWEIQDEEAARPQNFQEALSSSRHYVHRRLKWLRRFGPGAVRRGW